MNAFPTPTAPHVDRLEKPGLPLKDGHHNSTEDVASLKEDGGLANKNEKELSEEFRQVSNALNESSRLQGGHERVSASGVNGVSPAEPPSQVGDRDRKGSEKVNGIHVVSDNVQDRGRPPPTPSEGGKMGIIREESEEKEQDTITKLEKVDSETKKTVLKLTPAQLHELTASPGLVPVSPPMTGKRDIRPQVSSPHLGFHERTENTERSQDALTNGFRSTGHSRQRSGSDLGSPSPRQDTSMRASSGAIRTGEKTVFDRPSASRAFSTPTMRIPQSGRKSSNATQDRLKTETKAERAIPTPRLSNPPRPKVGTKKEDDESPSPMPISMPLPPFSLPTFLQLELSSNKPSPLYIYRSANSDALYEDSKIKIERLLNFLLLPPHLEMILWFGALACLDSWLHTFTILPLRFIKALWILLLSWARNLIAEVRFFASFIYAGVGRMWRRRKHNPEIKIEAIEERDSDMESESIAVEKPVLSPNFRFPPLGKEITHESGSVEQRPYRSHSAPKKHKRVRSAPSTLMQDHKADLLKGLLIVTSCVLLLYLDASMMYHSIRGQAAIKLYVIYNVLEVGMISIETP